MDNAITDLLDAIIPELDGFVSDMRFWMGLVMLLGPILLIALGAYYFFYAPPEANHKLGYRTHYGMGSVAAWKFTQAFAGRVWGFLGLGLLLVAIIGCVLMGSSEPAQAAMSGLLILGLEALSVLVGYGVIEFTVAGRYDKDGNLKKK